ncbi:MAG: cupredoxin domain-containing protein [Candidatus Acidiferrales bacterium]
MLTTAVMVLACAWPSFEARVTRAQDQSPQVIEMTAKKYEYSPSPVHVKAGTKVQLKITATDRVHGFKLSTTPDGAPKSAAPGLVLTSPAPNDCYRLEQGQQVTVEFTANTPGTYSFKCCVHCGLEHGSMKGQLIVDP